MAAEPWGASSPVFFTKDQPVPLPGGWREREVLEVLDLPLCVWRPGGTVQYANPAFLALSGHRADDLAGLHFYGDLFSPPDLDGLDGVSAAGALIHFSGMRQAGGGVSWVKVNRRAVNDRSGRVKCYVAVVRQAPGPDVGLPREDAAPPRPHTAKGHGWDDLKARLLSLPQPLIDPDKISPADLCACLRECLAGLAKHHLVEPGAFPVTLRVPDQALPREPGLFLAEAALDILHFTLPWDEEEPDPDTLHLVVERDAAGRPMLRVFARGGLLSVKPKLGSRLSGPLGPLARRVIARGGTLLVFKSGFREIRVTLPA